MLLDAKLIFCEDFDIDAISFGSAANVTSVIDMGAGKDEWGAALAVPGVGFSGLEWNVLCEKEDFASAGSPVITIDLHASATENMASPVTLLSVVSDKTPNAGDLLFSGKVPKVPADLRYFAVNVAVATADYTAGQITSWLGGPDGDGII